MSYNGETFIYDEIGNPTTYRNKTLSWSHARQLDSFGDIASFKYNANGIRISKSINGITTKYYLNGNKIISQTDGTNILFFYYGTDGITGFNHNGTDYFYKKNIQGDIIGIYDNTNTLICKYIYDAWGNHVCRILSNNGEYVDIVDTSNYNINSNYITIANLNPFRYRSYYYDTETGLYYLNSRYYDSELGRFINADDISILNKLQEELNGLNLYTYCFNNPVNDIDELGSWSWKKFWKIVGKYVATIVVVGLVTAAIAITVGAVATAIGGVALANSIVLPTVAGGLVAAGMSYIGQGVSNGFDNINLGTIAIDTFTGSAYGAIAGAFGGSPFLSDKILATLGNTLISGIASALHGLNGNKSREEIFNDMKLSMAYSLLYQTATIGIPLLFNFSNKTNNGKNILIDLYNKLNKNPTIKIAISRLLTGIFAILTNKYKR